MATAIYNAKAALKGMLEAHTWPVSTPTVTWGAPTEQDDHPPGGEMIYLAETEVSDEFTVLGGHRLDEEFALRVVVDVAQFGDDEQSTEERAWVLRDEIVELVRSDMTLGGTINRVTGFRVANTNAPSASQWRTQITVDLQAVAYEQLA